MAMTRLYAPLIAATGAILVVLGCGISGPPVGTDSEGSTSTEPVQVSRQHFAGAWSLVRIKRLDGDGNPLAPPISDRLGYLIYDVSGHMGVTIMSPDRQPYSEGGPTPDEALALIGTYTSYFGPFSINADEGYVTHHLVGSLDPRGAGSDYQRFYTFSENTLTLQTPPREDGSKVSLTWERLPDLPESELTETHKRLFGVYRIESVTRRTAEGEPVPINQYDKAYIIYAPSGHMSVHLMRPGRTRYAGDRPTPQEALMATRTYASYFGPFSVHRDQGFVVHHRIGSENPAGTGIDAQRFYELSDTHLTLRPPVQTDSEGREVQTALRWARIKG